jgi:HEAT repeat protein
MKPLRSRHLHVVVTAIGLLLGSPRHSHAESTEDLLKAGRYDAAYERARKEPGGGSTSLISLARTLLEQALASPDSYQRWFALRAARTLNDAALVPSLRKIAREGDRYEQSLALDALILTDPKQAREEFQQALGSPFRSVRLRGLRGLSGHRDPSLVDSLAKVAASDSDPDLRALAARALGESGAADAKQPLRRALDDPSEVVQEEAVRALSHLADETLAEVLRKRAESAEEPETRLRLIRLMGFVREDHVLDTLGPLLADGDAEVRSYAAAAIVRRQKLKDSPP